MQPNFILQVGWNKWSSC